MNDLLTITEDPNRPMPGQHWGAYTLLHFIAMGSFGVVYGCLDERFGIRVAAKFMLSIRKDKKLTFDDLFSRETEYAVQRSMCSKYVVKALDHFYMRGYEVIILELAGGGTLKEYVNLHGRLTEDQIQCISVQLAEGLLYYRSLNLFNGDLKEENVVLMREDDITSIKFIDVASMQSYCHEEDLVPLNVATENMKSFAVLRGRYDSGYDLWCLGVMVLHMMLGTTRLAYGTSGNEVALPETIGPEGSAKPSQSLLDFLSFLLSKKTPPSWTMLRLSPFLHLNTLTVHCIMPSNDTDEEKPSLEIVTEKFTKMECDHFGTMDRLLADLLMSKNREPYDAYVLLMGEDKVKYVDEIDYRLDEVFAMSHRGCVTAFVHPFAVRPIVVKPHVAVKSLDSVAEYSNTAHRIIVMVHLMDEKVYVPVKKSYDCAMEHVRIALSLLVMINDMILILKEHLKEYELKMRDHLEDLNKSMSTVLDDLSEAKSAHKVLEKLMASKGTQADPLSEKDAAAMDQTKTSVMNVPSRSVVESATRMKVFLETEPSVTPLDAGYHKQWMTSIKQLKASFGRIKRMRDCGLMMVVSVNAYADEIQNTTSTAKVEKGEKLMSITFNIAVAMLDEELQFAEHHEKVRTFLMSVHQVYVSVSRGLGLVLKVKQQLELDRKGVHAMKDLSAAINERVYAKVVSDLAFRH